jgi:nitrite reductase (NADH) small subunit
VFARKDDASLGAIPASCTTEAGDDAHTREHDMIWRWFRRARWHAVARVGELKPGELKATTVEGTEIVLGRDGDRYFAVQRQCAHRQSDLVAGFVADHYVVCPQHGWRFSTETGEHAGVFDACLKVYAVRVVGEQIEVDPTPRPRTRKP